MYGPCQELPLDPLDSVSGMVWPDWFVVYSRNSWFPTAVNASWPGIPWAST